MNIGQPKLVYMNFILSLCLFRSVGIQQLLGGRDYLLYTPTYYDCGSDFRGSRHNQTGIVALPFIKFTVLRAVVNNITMLVVLDMVA